MKVKRQKKVGRILSFFQHNFGHRHPFQVLLDGTFCQACLSVRVWLCIYMIVKLGYNNIPGPTEFVRYNWVGLCRKCSFGREILFGIIENLCTITLK